MRHPAMPGTEWFPGCPAELRRARPGQRRGGSGGHRPLPVRGGSPAHLGPAPGPGRPVPGRPPPAGRPSGRPGRRLPAQRPGGRGGLPGHGQPRRRLVLVPARVRGAQRDRPVRAARPGRPPRGPRLPVRGQVPRPVRRGRRHRGLPAHPAGRGGRRPPVGQPGGRTGRAGLRPRAVRPPAVRALLVRDHRAAEGHRPRPRRDPARAPQVARPPPRPGTRRPVLLVLDDRVDDVEPPGVGPLRGVHHRAVRRRPGLARPRRPVAPGRGDRRHRVRGERPVPPGVPERPPRAGVLRRPVRCPVGRVDRCPVARRGIRVGARTAAPRLADVGERGHRRLHGLRGG